MTLLFFVRRLLDWWGCGREANQQNVHILQSHPAVLDYKCLDFTGVWQISWLKLQQSFAMWPTVAVSIEFYLGSQLFAHHYTGSASPRLPLEQHWPCAGLFARSFIYAIQISTPLLVIWDANKLVQGCCAGTDWGRVKERDGDTDERSAPHFCAGRLYHTPTL